MHFLKAIAEQVYYIILKHGIMILYYMYMFTATSSYVIASYYSAFRVSSSDKLGGGGKHDK